MYKFYSYQIQMTRFYTSFTYLYETLIDSEYKTT